MTDVKKAFDEEDAIKKFEEEGKKELANLGKNVANAEPLRYNKKRTASYISYNKVGSENISNIRSQLETLFEGTEDAIANNVALKAMEQFTLLMQALTVGKFLLELGQLTLFLMKL